MIAKDHDDERIALCNLLNATFPHGHFVEAKTVAEAVILASACSELPEIIMIDIDIPNMSIAAIKWIKRALPSSLIIILINHRR